MKLATATAALVLMFTAGCDRGAAPPGESGTNTAPVSDNSGEKPVPQVGSTGSARAERGSGTTETNSAGSTTGSGATSTGGTSR